MASSSRLLTCFGNAIRSQRVRTFNSSKARLVDGEIHPRYFKRKEIQKTFQVDNGLLIHQRHGMTGSVLYGLTLALVGVAAVDCVMFYYGYIFPSKK